MDGLLAVPAGLVVTPFLAALRWAVGEGLGIDAEIHRSAPLDRPQGSGPCPVIPLMVRLVVFLVSPPGSPRPGLDHYENTPKPCRSFAHSAFIRMGGRSAR